MKNFLFSNFKLKLILSFVITLFLRLPICAHPLMIGVDILCPRFFEVLIDLISTLYHEGILFIVFIFFDVILWGSYLIYMILFFFLLSLLFYIKNRIVIKRKKN